MRIEGRAETLGRRVVQVEKVVERQHVAVVVDIKVDRQPSPPHIVVAPHTHITHITHIINALESESRT